VVAAAGARCSFLPPDLSYVVAASFWYDDVGVFNYVVNAAAAVGSLVLFLFFNSLTNAFEKKFFFFN